MKIFVVGPDDLPVIKMFSEALGEDDTVYTEADLPWDQEVLKQLDLVVFTGGSDVSPHLYGEENISSFCDPNRDEMEISRWNVFSELKIPMVGICRGGQFLNVMNGGKLIQDVSGHYMCHHSVKLSSGETVIVHGDHHQAIVPAENAEVIAKAEDDVIEVCFYHDSRCLCFQPHPEWGHEETQDFFFDLLIKKGMWE